MNASIVIAARNRLNKQRGQWLMLTTNSGISYSWLSKFARGHITNPRVGTLDRLTASLDEVERATFDHVYGNAALPRAQRQRSARAAGDSPVAPPAQTSLALESQAAAPDAAGICEGGA